MYAGGPVVSIKEVEREVDAVLQDDCVELTEVTLVEASCSEAVADVSCVRETLVLDSAQSVTSVVVDVEERWVVDLELVGSSVHDVDVEVVVVEYQELDLVLVDDVVVYMDDEFVQGSSDVEGRLDVRVLVLQLDVEEVVRVVVAEVVGGVDTDAAANSEQSVDDSGPGPWVAGPSNDDVRVWLVVVVVELASKLASSQVSVWAWLVWPGNQEELRVVVDKGRDPDCCPAGLWNRVAEVEVLLDELSQGHPVLCAAATVRERADVAVGSQSGCST